MAKDKIFFIHRGKTGLSPTQYYYLVKAKDEDSALEKVGLFDGDEELIVVERVWERSLSSAQLKEGALIAQVEHS